MEWFDQRGVTRSGRRRSVPARTPAGAGLARSHLGRNRHLDRIPRAGATPSRSRRERACPPRRARATRSSLAPFATCGCSPKPGVEAMYTVTCAIRTSLSNEPSSARSAESAWSAARRPPSKPCSTETPPPSSPGCSTCPSMIGTCPATNASVPDTTTGTYEATGTGGARELESLLGDALQDVRVVHGAHPPTNRTGACEPAGERRAVPSARRLPRRVDAAWPAAPSRSGRPRCRGLRGPPGSTRGTRRGPGTKRQMAFATASRASFSRRFSK